MLILMLLIIQLACLLAQILVYKYYRNLLLSNMFLALNLVICFIWIGYAGYILM
jgi:hypothetical protein